jgi:hypothetical protein
MFDNVWSKALGVGNLNVLMVPSKFRVLLGKLKEFCENQCDSEITIEDILYIVICVS